MKKILLEKKDESGSPVIVLQGEFIINNIIEYRKAIIEKLKSENPIKIDLSDINKIDTAGLQVLLAAKRKINEENLEIELINPSTEVDTIFNLYGLTL